MEKLIKNYWIGLRDMKSLRVVGLNTRSYTYDLHATIVDNYSESTK